MAIFISLILPFQVHYVTYVHWNITYLVFSFAQFFGGIVGSLTGKNFRNLDLLRALKCSELFTFYKTGKAFYEPHSMKPYFALLF